MQERNNEKQRSKIQETERERPGLDRFDPTPLLLKAASDLPLLRAGSIKQRNRDPKAGSRTTTKSKTLEWETKNLGFFQRKEGPKIEEPLKKSKTKNPSSSSKRVDSERGGEVNKGSLKQIYFMVPCMKSRKAKASVVLVHRLGFVEMTKLAPALLAIGLDG
ncbi:hypothetical protein ACLOJK_017457 [Asimina triloba]